MDGVIHAVETVRSTLEGLENIRQVIFCRFSAGDLAVYRKLLAAAD